MYAVSDSNHDDEPSADDFGEDDNDVEEEGQLIDPSDVIDSIACRVQSSDGVQLDKRARLVLYGAFFKLSTRLRRFNRRVRYSDIERVHVERSASSASESGASSSSAASAGNVVASAAAVTLHIDYAEKGKLVLSSIRHTNRQTATNAEHRYF